MNIEQRNLHWCKYSICPLVNFCSIFASSKQVQKLLMSLAKKKNLVECHRYFLRHFKFSNDDLSVGQSSTRTWKFSFKIFEYWIYQTFIMTDDSRMEKPILFLERSFPLTIDLGKNDSINLNEVFLFIPEYHYWWVKCLSFVRKIEIHISKYFLQIIQLLITFDYRWFMLESKVIYIFWSI